MGRLLTASEGVEPVRSLPDRREWLVGSGAYVGIIPYGTSGLNTHKVPHDDS